MFGPHLGMSTVVHYRWGGFVISRQAAAEWASRITGQTYTDRQYWAIQNAIQPKVRVFNAGFRLIGESREEMGFMVVTRTEKLIGYELGSPVQPFPEGERETMAKPLLEGEGQLIISVSPNQ
jgi:hypothetical protein